MGRKRRLLHSKKFAAKHDNHPRMKMLNKTTAPLIVIEEKKDTETATTLNLQAVADEIMAEDPVVEESVAPPKPETREIAPKKKTQKVAASATSKATTKATTKTTTTKKTPAKKTTTTRKRSTRTKTKTTTA